MSRGGEWNTRPRVILGAGMGEGDAIGAARGGPRWSLAHRVGFRFLAIYLFLYSFPFPLGYIPGTESLAEVVGTPLSAPVPWVGRHMLGITDPITLHPTGSGD